jgi:hypothetical protein
MFRIGGWCWGKTILSITSDVTNETSSYIFMALSQHGKTKYGEYAWHIKHYKFRT